MSERFNLPYSVSVTLQRSFASRSRIGLSEVIYDRVQKSWTKIVMTLLEGDSKCPNQSAQRETSYFCRIRVLVRAVLKSLVIFRGKLCSGDVFKLEVKIGFLQKLYLDRFRNFWLNIEVGANF
ncbi:hypothetical protein QL285_033280 [Trifolium repens]|nr:hypothetical protein QL285_033280 [Trifolium repens]